MRDTLYIQLTDAGADGLLPYAVTGARPDLGVQVERAPLETLLGLAPGRRVVAFVPGADVRLATAQVPAKQEKKILQAVPYALEDQLAEDVDTLHFAIHFDPRNRRDNDPVPVAIISRARIDQWLNPLRARGLRLDALVPETLALPRGEDHKWSGVADANHVTVRTGAYAGFSCTPADLATYLQLADADAKVPLRLFTTPDVKEDFTQLSRPIELMPGQASVLEVLVRNWRPEGSINLLQGAYSEARDWNKAWAPWRLAASLAMVWVVMALLQQGVQLHRLGQDLKVQQARNLARFQELFPAEKKIFDLAGQTEAQYRKLHGGARAPLLPLLELVSASLAANPNLSLKSLQFREGALYLNLTGKDVQALEALRGWYANKKEASLEVQSANSGAEGVQIRLKVSLLA